MRRFIALPLAIAACTSDDGARRPDFSTRVEDGVTIAENAGLHVADTLAWSIDTVAIARIGLVDGPEEYLFGRIGGVLLLPDSTILVGDAMAREIRVFDMDGQFIRKMGREGDAPGEFSGIERLALLAGDSVAVIDEFWYRRIEILDPDLRFVRRFSPGLGDEIARYGARSDKVVRIFADGTSLMNIYLRRCESGTGVVCTDSAAFFRTDEKGAVLARYGRHAYERSESHHVRANTFRSFGEPHPQLFWTTHGTRFYYADATRFEILVYGSDGTLERKIRVAGTASRYTKDEIQYPGAAETVSMPDTFPSFSDMLVDSSGNIWVYEYLPRKNRRLRRWFVFDPEGRLRYSFRTAPDFVRNNALDQLIEPFIGENHIAAVRDPVGIGTVVVYRINKRN